MYSYSRLYIFVYCIVLFIAVFLYTVVHERPHRNQISCMRLLAYLANKRDSIGFRLLSPMQAIYPSTLHPALTEIIDQNTVLSLWDLMLYQSCLLCYQPDHKLSVSLDRAYRHTCYKAAFLHFQKKNTQENG